MVRRSSSRRLPSRPRDTCGCWRGAIRRATCRSARGACRGWMSVRGNAPSYRWRGTCSPLILPTLGTGTSPTSTTCTYRAAPPFTGSRCAVRGACVVERTTREGMIHAARGTRAPDLSMALTSDGVTGVGCGAVNTCVVWRVVGASFGSWRKHAVKSNIH